MLPHFEQAEPTESLTSDLKGVLAFLLLPLQSLLVAGVQVVEGVLALAFGFGP